MSGDNKSGIGREKVVEIVASVIERVRSSEELSRDHLYRELRALHDLIEETRQDIGRTNFNEISGKHIPSAMDELDAVVAATEVATSAIMDSCDAIQAESETMDAHHKEFLIGEVTKILEACSFQDITGQRITKVVKSLKVIEEKVSALMNILEDKIPGLPMGHDDDKRQGDARLMNGPQLPDKAVTQEDIDKLLADLF
jgi:chemotaxis protein CheZ